MTVAPAVSGSTEVAGGLRVDAAVLQLFWDLAALDSSVRQAAAGVLVEEIQKAQNAFDQQANGKASSVPLKIPGTDDDAKDQAQIAMAGCCPLAAYTLRRLARGLSSGREGARAGFATAFAEVLAVLVCVPLTLAPDILSAFIEPVTGSFKAREANDTYLGQLFGLVAIARASASRQKNEGGNSKKKDLGKGKNDTLELLQKLLEQITDLASKKPFLRNAASSAIVDLLAPLPKKDLTILLGPDSKCTTLIAWLQAPVHKATSEGLAVLLTLWPRLDQSFTSDCPLLPSTAHSASEAAISSFFHRDHLAQLSEVLKATTSSHPHFHFLWKIIFGMLLPEGAPCPIDTKPIRPKKPKKGKKGDKEETDTKQDSNEKVYYVKTAAASSLWETIVENELVGSSHERRYLGFELFSLLLPRMDPLAAASLFTPQFLACLMTNLAEKDNYLHKRAQVCAQDIVQYLRACPAPEAKVGIVAVIQRLVGSRFDRLTGTQTVAKLVKAGDNTSDDSAKKTFYSLKEMFLHPEDPERAPIQRAFAIDQMASLWKTQSFDDKCRTELLCFLALHAFYEVSGKKAPAPMKTVGLDKLQQPEPALDTPTRDKCATRLMTLVGNAAAQLASFANSNTKDGKQGDAQEKERVDQLEVLCQFQAGMEASKEVSLVKALEEDALAARKGAVELVTELRADMSGEDGPVDGRRGRPLLALIQMLGIHQTSDSSAYTEVIEDLCIFYEKAKAALAAAAAAATPGKKNKKGKKKDAEEEEDEGPHHMDVLVDLLLSLLSKSNAPLREASERVFRGWCADITPTGISDLVNILTETDDRTKRRQAGRKGAGDEDDDEEDEGILDMEDDSEDDDEDEDESEVESGNDSDLDGNDSDDDDDDNEDKDRKGGAANGNTKKKGKKNEDMEVDEEEEDDESDMDDDAMEKIDSMLGQAFLSARQEKQQSKQVAEALMHFKFRVCSLLDIYVRKQPASPQLPGLVLPLLNALKAASAPAPHGNPSLAQKISSVITTGICKGRTVLDAAEGKGEVPSESELCEMLHKCAGAASRSTLKGMSLPAGAACHYYLRLLSASGPDHGGEEAVRVFTTLLKHFFTRKDCKLNRKFFEEVLNKAPWMRSQLYETLLQACIDARSDYIRVEAAALVSLATRLIGESKEGGAEAAIRPHLQLMGQVVGVLGTGDYTKAQKKWEALKSTCAILEVIKKTFKDEALDSLMDLTDLKGASKSTSNVSPKVAVQLTRLEGLVGVGNKKRSRKSEAVDEKVGADRDQGKAVNKKQKQDIKKEGSKGEKKVKVKKKSSKE